jgi:hypothetical protein
MTDFLFGLGIGFAASLMIKGVIGTVWVIGLFGVLVLTLIALWCISLIERFANGPPTAPRWTPPPQPLPPKRRFYRDQHFAFVLAAGLACIPNGARAASIEFTRQPFSTTHPSSAETIHIGPARAGCRLVHDQIVCAHYDDHGNLKEDEK